jgi:hypothetical protein
VTPSLSTFSQRDIRGERKRKKGGKRKKREEREKEPRQLKGLYIQTRKNRARSARRDSESTGKVEAPPIP